ncbi:hypothetical protein DSO57_1003044 [Entomophthora muscae]|uniref:Uncharacterized protein n=1 Tax=Entomophthora muscae TaxID=34485 RepID=A0ACC2TJU4_9FUNG|nr:hypothetical protein DSO57_1003044 [Entomophthora muscae]
MVSLIHSRYDELPPWGRILMRGIAEVAKLAMLSIVPLAVLVLFSLFRVGPWSPFDAILFLWGMCEVGFHFNWKARLQAPFMRKAFVMDFDQRTRLAHRLMEHVDDAEKTLGSWLLLRPKGRLHLGYFRRWLMWLFFDKKVEEMTPEEKSQGDVILKIFESRLQPASDQPLENHALMFPTMDAMVCYPKPFIVHLAIQAVHLLAFWKLRWLGFRRCETRRLSYWFLPGDSFEPPIMYIHGIGIGFAMYLPKLQTLLEAYPQRSVVLLELPHVSMAHTNVILDHDQTLYAIDAIFEHHHLGKVSLVAHSFGTLMASWIVRQRPQYLARVVLVDAVCFRMWDSTLAYNFLYAKPFSFIHDLARFFIAQDPLVTHTLSKELYWYESVLYPEDIPVPATIFLASHDWVVDAMAIERYLAPRLPPGCNVILMDTHHGGSLIQNEHLLRVIQCV